MMSEKHPESSLPQVTENDVLTFSVQDVIDPDHRAVWMELGQQSPALAREILSRVFGSAEGDPKKQQIVLNEVTFALGAIGVALLREQREEQKRRTAQAGGQT